MCLVWWLWRLPDLVEVNVEIREAKEVTKEERVDEEDTEEEEERIWCVR